MNYQILVLDLDGTLTNSKKQITPPTQKALIDIQEKGKKVVLASGRPTNGVAPLADQLHLQEYGSYILSFNGGRITDCRSKEVIYNRILPPEVILPAYEIVKKYLEQDINIITYTSDSILSCSEPNQYTLLESKINSMPVLIKEDFPAAVTFPVNKLLITGSPSLIAQIQEEMKQRFHSYLSIYCSEPFFLEIMPMGVDKAASLQRLLNSIGLTSNEMICCGDGYNDLTMIESAGLGVAMANAQSIVLERANYITKSNDEDGVLHVINQFMR